MPSAASPERGAHPSSKIKRISLGICGEGLHGSYNVRQFTIHTPVPSLPCSRSRSLPPRVTRGAISSTTPGAGRHSPGRTVYAPPSASGFGGPPRTDKLIEWTRAFAGTRRHDPGSTRGCRIWGAHRARSTPTSDLCSRRSPTMSTWATNHSPRSPSACSSRRNSLHPPRRGLDSTPHHIDKLAPRWSPRRPGA